MQDISENIEKIIQSSVENFDGNYNLDNPFEKLLSFGELVDRLSIVNFKLYTLKNEVMKREPDTEFKAWASVEDVKLVEERARLKKCIDEKLISMIAKHKSGDENAGFNSEVKKYG
tara:strand:+ start:1049 stop:1396 length:348 start_codon:yes stop_codon:yes gene_type:complete